MRSTISEYSSLITFVSCLLGLNFSVFSQFTIDELRLSLKNAMKIANWIKQVAHMLCNCKLRLFICLKPSFRVHIITWWSPYYHVRQSIISCLRYAIGKWNPHTLFSLSHFCTFCALIIILFIQFQVKKINKGVRAKKHRFYWNYRGGFYLYINIGIFVYTRDNLHQTNLDCKDDISTWVQSKEHVALANLTKFVDFFILTNYSIVYIKFIQTRTVVEFKLECRERN